MSTRERVFERLVAMNPLTEVEEFVPSTADAEAFLRSIEEGLMDTTTQKLLEPLEPHRPRRPWMAAAAAFAVVILVIGGVALWPAGSTDEPQATTLAPLPTTTPPPTTVSPTMAAPEPTPPTPAQASVIEELVAAYNAGDIDRYMALFAPEVVFSFPDRGGPDVPQGRGSGTAFTTSPDLWRLQKQWEMDLDGSILIHSCSQRSNGAECTITYTDAFVALVMSPLNGVVEFALDDDGLITDYRQDWDTHGETYDSWSNSFAVWLEENHPDELTLMAQNLGMDPVHTAESARLWRELSAEFLGVPSG